MIGEKIAVIESLIWRAFKTIITQLSKYTYLILNYLRKATLQNLKKPQKLAFTLFVFSCLIKVFKILVSLLKKKSNKNVSTLLNLLKIFSLTCTTLSKHFTNQEENALQLSCTTNYNIQYKKVKEANHRFCDTTRKKLNEVNSFYSFSVNRFITKLIPYNLKTRITTNRLIQINRLVNYTQKEKKESIIKQSSKISFMKNQKKVKNNLISLEKEDLPFHVIFKKYLQHCDNEKIMN